MKNTPFIVGLTGGIGAGKTEATVILESFGAYIIDADEISRFVSKKEQKGYDALKKEFPLFFDDSGNLDRKNLREYIFNNKLSDRLNQIMFPIIISEIESRILSTNESIVFIVAPLLIESGMNKVCNTVILITAEYEKRIERIMLRDNIERQLAKSMIDSQISDEERKKSADIVICNDFGTDKLYRKIKYYYEKIKKTADEDN